MRVFSGVAIGVVLGVGLDWSAEHFLIGQAIVDKPLQMLRAIPFNALTPLFIIAFGVGETMKVLLIGVGVLFRCTSTPLQAFAVSIPDWSRSARSTVSPSS